MSWRDKCHDFDSRLEASAEDESFHDVTFLLLHDDAENTSGDKIGANKYLLSLVSSVFYAQFYGPLAVDVKLPVEIVDGTAYGFKEMMDFINHPKSYEMRVDGPEDVFEIVYFAHKYQIGTLVNYCRLFLGSFGSQPTKEGFRSYFETEEALDILQWARTNSHLENSFLAEYHLLVQSCWKIIGGFLKKIFPDGNIRNDRPFPEEELMMKVLAREALFATESFILSVALNYFIKLIDGLTETTDNHQNKKFKMDKIQLWEEKLEKITKVINLERVSPSTISDILDRVEDKMPASIIDNIMAKFTVGEQSKTSFQEKNRAEFYNQFIEFDVFRINPTEDEDENDHDEENENSDDMSITSSEFGELHTVNVDNESTIKFTINKNSIFCGKYVWWEDTKNLEAITFQNGSDYEEIVKEDWRYGQNGVKFFAKANTPITLSYKVLQNKGDLAMYEVRNSNITSQTFHMNILEVNGKPVSSDNPMCYSLLSSFFFLPV